MCGFCNRNKKYQRKVKSFSKYVAQTQKYTNKHKMKQDRKIEHKAKMHQDNLAAVSKDLKINVDIYAYIKCVACIFLKRSINR